jgi:hypothetical protein
MLGSSDIAGWCALMPLGEGSGHVTSPLATIRPIAGQVLLAINSEWMVDAEKVAVVLSDAGPGLVHLETPIPQDMESGAAGNASLVVSFPSKISASIADMIVAATKN